MKWAHSPSLISSQMALLSDDVLCLTSTSRNHSSGENIYATRDRRQIGPYSMPAADLSLRPAGKSALTVFWHMFVECEGTGKQQRAGKGMRRSKNVEWSFLSKVIALWFKKSTFFTLSALISFNTYINFVSTLKTDICTQATLETFILHSGRPLPVRWAANLM